MSLDTRTAGWQTGPPDWFDHWTSVARACQRHYAPRTEKLGSIRRRGHAAPWRRRAESHLVMNNVEFTVAGSPRVISRTIEAHVDHHRAVSAIVVPWESDGSTLSMAVTLTRGEGWAIEHVNLGTIRLTDLGDDRTRVTIAPEKSTDLDEDKLALVLHEFARQIQSRFQGAT